MSFRKLTPLFILAAVLTTAVSCKDDEETEVAPYLNGNLSFNVEAFVTPNQIVTMKPSGASHPDGKGVGYSWKVTPGMEKSDTVRLQNGLSPDGKESDGSFTYEFPDSLATYTVSCTAFAKDYSSLTASANVTVVQPGLDGSITGTGIKASDPKIKDGDVDYYYISHDGLDWMRTNLANPAYGSPYANAEAASDVLGRFYSYEEAMKACPEGWRLPTDKEWRELAAKINEKSAAEAFAIIPEIAADLMGDVKFNLITMWEYWPEVGDITNKGEIAILPAGYANLGEKKNGRYPMATYKGLGEYAIFWTSDKAADEEGMAYYRYLICDQPDMHVGKGDMKTFGASVRCVRESL